MSHLKRSDFVNDNEVRWCPGCGDYAILAALQKALPEMGLPPERHVFISGIGCSGRLPYYMNTYGFHTIHGRACTVATGLAAMREDLTVWVITGDGDALSIGGNHLLHCLRRNVNLKILMINNQVYGLTKGQFSPTSPQNQITKTSPQGSGQSPINPILFALSAGATFVARAVDKDPAHLSELLLKAYHHKGSVFIEILQDCHIFNAGAFDAFSLKNNRKKNTILMSQENLLLFGEQEEFGLNYDGGVFDKTTKEKAVYRHQIQDINAAMALSQLSFPQFPVPIGIFYQEDKEIYKLNGSCQKSTEDLSLLYRSRANWQN